MHLNTKDSRHHQLLIAILLAILLLLLFLMVSSSAQPQKLFAQEPANERDVQNSVAIELFYRGDSSQSQDARAYLEGLSKERAGLTIKCHDVIKDKKQLQRVWKLSKRFGMKQAKVPMIYLCDRIILGFDEKVTAPQIDDLLTIKTYVRPGCKHCKDGKQFLNKMVQRWPALKVEYYDVVNDLVARQQSQDLITRFQVQVPSFPCIKVAGRLVVGFQSAEITGAKIEAIFQDRSVDFPKSTSDTETRSDATPKQPNKIKTPDDRLNQTGVTTKTQLTISALATLNPPLFTNLLAGNQEPADKTDSQIPEEDFQLPGEASLPVQADGFPVDIDASESISEQPADEIEVPWFGKLSVSSLGLPTFTFLIGLVDGFNPCAMWVLIFLLSVLVNIKERKKILLVAGTFVVVSGLAYFVFMAAWFNVFQLIGYLRPVQIGLGIVAIIIGAINVKDFFAFHKGVTLSIPESAKPGLYRRVRGIVSANHMATALSGAIVLAIVVNIVELLCTAGLPALYTEVLTMQNLTPAENYSYLALYISAYMLDDTIMVLIVVCTLSNRRLQESEGRWLKLMSGLVILALGIVMIFWPNALV